MKSVEESALWRLGSNLLAVNGGRRTVRHNVLLEGPEASTEAAVRGLSGTSRAGDLKRPRAPLGSRTGKWRAGIATSPR